MKTIANRMILVAAGALALGSAAYGQTAMTAKIPFAFRVSNTTMPAGKYLVTQRMDGGIAVTGLRNDAANRNALAAGGPLDWYSKGEPRITFLCRADSCSLSKIRTSAGSYSYPVERKASHETRVASVVSVAMTTAHGD